MKIIIGTAGIGLATALLVACGSSTKTTEKKEHVQVVQTETSGIATLKTTETIRYGDTLQGTVPLLELTDKPVEYEIESGGTKLSVKIQKGKMSYEVLPKAIETKRVVESSEATTQTTLQAVATSETKHKTKREQWKPPWWTYILFFIAGLAVGIYLSNPVKTFIKLFKIF